MKNSLKINQFYIGMIVLMVLLAVLVIVSLRGIFSALAIAGQVDEALLSSTLPRIEASKLDEALQATEVEEFTPLDL